jgi:hypothetical protein
MDLAQLPVYQKRVFVPENADLTDVPPWLVCMKSWKAKPITLPKT